MLSGERNQFIVRLFSSFIQEVPEVQPYSRSESVCAEIDDLKEEITTYEKKCKKLEACLDKEQRNIKMLSELWSKHVSEVFTKMLDTLYRKPFFVFIIKLFIFCYWHFSVGTATCICD